MDGCITLIKQSLPSLSVAETKIARTVLQYPDKVIEYNVAQLAKKAKTSPATVIRFCKHLGFSGYHDFILNLVKEIYTKQDLPKEKDTFSNFDDKLSMNEIADNLVDVVRGSLLTLKDLLIERDLSETISMIKKSNRIVLIGAGASAMVANDLHMKLARLGFSSEINDDFHMQLVLSSTLKKNDLAIVFSYSGETSVAIESAKLAKNNGANIVAITRIGTNSLSKIADVAIKIPNTEALFRKSATVSRIEQLLVVDILFLTLAKDCDDANEKLANTWHAVSKFRNS